MTDMKRPEVIVIPRYILIAGNLRQDNTISQAKDREGGGHDFVRFIDNIMVLHLVLLK